MAPPSGLWWYFESHRALYNWTEERVDCADLEKRELEDGVAHFSINTVAANTRASYETRGKHFCSLLCGLFSSTVKAYLSAVGSLHLDLGYALPEFRDLPRLRQTLRGIKRLKGHPTCKKLDIGPKELTSIFRDGKVSLTKTNDRFRWTGCLLLAFGGCFKEANITAKKPGSFPRPGVMLCGSVKFLGKDQMEVSTMFSKANQFAAQSQKVFFGTVKYTIFCAIALTHKALAANRLPDAVDEYHKITNEQRLAIPKLVSESIVAAVEARC
ncbi:hypothetical protein CYMTET_23074 [Cymbomonas tetramitiformis]|uniref:Uncharacterized protein n=1 Tax=Cymbomonas tetramitiformis TaxID=36881 RepID=A0AAE0FZF6_9CHLO|nr:hypothetical protein CYMTET_23074 [Cymbomonas tetramitiformis]|eukprot:gene34081-biopygen10584